MERDQKCIVTNVVCVSVDFATCRIQSIRIRPRPASRLSHHLRYKARWRAPRPAHGEEGQWAQHRLGPLSPPRSAPTQRGHRPHLAGPHAAPLWGANPPAPRLSSPSSWAGSGGAHAEVGPAPSCAGSRYRRSGPVSPAPSPRPILGAQGAGQPRTLGTENPGKGGRARGRPVPASRSPPPGVAGLPGWPGHPPAQREVLGELGEAAGAGPALRGRDLGGAGNGGERPRLLVCAAPASPGREFDFRVWPQVGQGEHKAREKSPRGAGAMARSLFARGALPCSTLFL